MRLIDILRVDICLIGLGATSLFFSGEALACGIEWKLPQSHFEGVDEQGHVLYGEKIGALDVGGDLQIPIHIMFKSNWMANSPCLGKGWMLPLLESRIEQTAERSYRLWQPDGWYRDFWCSKSSNTVLNGQGNWKAEIRGETLTAWAPCGWKLVFTKNRLSAIVTQKNQRLDLTSRNGQVTEVLANGLSVLRVERDAMTGRVKGLILRGGERIAIEQQARPRVQPIGEQKTVRGDDYSLSKVTLADGTVKTYEFGMVDQRRPTLKIGDRLIVWNGTNQLIAQDGPWTYDIKPDEKNPWANAAIGRKNAKGENEFWYYDGIHGQEIVQNLNQPKIVKSWFTSGKLSGKMRKTEKVQNGQSISCRRYHYDEHGQLLREICENDGEREVIDYVFDPAKMWVEGRKDDEIVWRKTYDLNGQLLEWRRSTNVVRYYTYPSSGVVECIDRYIDGSWEKLRIIESKLSSKQYSTGKTEFYDQAERLTEVHEINASVWKYIRNGAGEIVRVMQDDQIFSQIVHAPKSGRTFYVRYNEGGTIQYASDVQDKRRLSDEELDFLKKELSESSANKPNNHKEML